MTSAEKLAAFSDSLLDTDEVLPGALGLLQATASMDKMQGGTGLAHVLGTDDPAELDETFLDIARFCLWIRSDDAPRPTADELAKPPQVLADLLAER